MKFYRVLTLILVLGLLTSVVTIWPVMKSGPRAAFYTIDPDVQYLSNSFSYVEKGKIQYDVHPGTPTIMLHAFSLWPLRFYAKLIDHQPFVTWVFNNSNLTYFYVRIFQALWLGVAVMVFLGAINRWCRSAWVLTPAWFGLMSYSVFPYFGSTIVPETTSFFIVGLWLFVLAGPLSLVRGGKKQLSFRTFFALSLLAGLAIANKFANLALVPATLLLINFLPEKRLGGRIRMASISTLVMAATFFMATWSIRRSYLGIWRWVVVLASTTGTHGGGKKAIFDIIAFRASASSLLHREWWPALILLVMLILLVLMVSRRKVSLLSPLAILGFVAAGSALVFAKFPLSHYQVANYTIILFTGAILISYLPRATTLLVLALLLPMVSTNLANYSQASLRMMDQASRLEHYVAEHPGRSGTLWEWARNKDFSYLWSRDWAHGAFDRQLSQFRPDLLAITPDLERIKINNRENKSVFEVCWDKFYVQTVTAPRFLAKYDSRALVYKTIPGVEDIGLIESDHCQK